MSTKHKNKDGEFFDPLTASTVPEGEEVVFELDVPADDELVVTQHAEAEKIIKKALNLVDETEGREPKYSIPVKTDPDVQGVKALLNILDDDEISNAKEQSDGTYAEYYDLPEGLTEDSSIQDLISFKDMNAQLGEIFRAVYRYGEVEHSDRMRDAKKIKFYIEAEIARLEKYVLEKHDEE